MSEYQYYEWQTLERLLTAAEPKAVNGLSSHIDVTSTQAMVTYEWGDFKHDPIQVLAKYFDAHLYLTNWGTRRLAFRFPIEKPQAVLQTNPRTFGELLKTAEKLRTAATKRQVEEKRKKHIAEMQELAKRETQTWQDVEHTLASGYTASNYDHATNLLDKLQQLADFQGREITSMPESSYW